jgi:hypothetical protein
MKIVTMALAGVALVLALLAILGVVHSATAIGLAVICLALAVVLPHAAEGNLMGGQRVRTTGL